MSDNIGALAAALAKAQGVMRGAAKDKANPHLKSKYADLASVWDACREPLSANGLAIVQLVQVADDSRVAVETRLLHASGESLSSVCVVPVAQKTAQGVGSAITYARRYGLSAMVGVAPDDDDDGHAASARPAQRQESRPPPASPPSPAAPPSPRRHAFVDAPPAPDADPLTLEVVALRAAIERATSEAELSALVPRITALPARDKATVRVAWGAKRDALRGGK